MTNYVTNRLTVEGTKSDIDEFVDVCCSPAPGGAYVLDLGKLIPIPPALEGTPSSSDAEIGIEILTRKPRARPIGERSVLDGEWAKKAGIRTYDDLARWGRWRGRRAVKAGRKCLAAFEQTGYWFLAEWAADNWGTTLSLDFRIHGRTDNFLEATFQTAWTPADKVYHEIARRLPQLKIEILAIEESGRFAYRFAAQDGRVSEQYPDYTKEFVARVEGDSTA
jgi:hypothetical protein